jgi:gas vesicle protein
MKLLLLLILASSDIAFAQVNVPVNFRADSIAIVDSVPKSIANQSSLIQVNGDGIVYHTVRRPLVQVKRVYYTSLLSMQGNKTKAFLYDLGDSSLQLTNANPLLATKDSFDHVMEFRYTGIDEIRMRKKGSIGSGVLIGILGGAVIGAVAGAMTTKTVPNYVDLFHIDGFSQQSNAAEGVFIGAVVGSVTGAILGALIHKKFIIKGSREKYNEMYDKMMKKLY